jgi:hypothetical protein
MYDFDCDYDRGDECCDEAPSGYCQCCGEHVTAVCEDYGIGAYEYGGAPGFDSDEQWVSPCCEADVGDNPPEENEEE